MLSWIKEQGKIDERKADTFSLTLLEELRGEGKSSGLRDHGGVGEGVITAQ